MFSEDEVENVGPDLQEDNIVDSGEVNPGEEVDMFDPGEGTSSGNKSRSRTSQWRFENKILEAANHDAQAIAGAHQKVLPNKDAAYVAKRISTDPHLGEPLRKYIKKLDKDLEKMNDEINLDEEGEIPSPIKCLAFMLGSFTCHVQNETHDHIISISSVMEFLIWWVKISYIFCKAFTMYLNLEFHIQFLT